MTTLIVLAAGLATRYGGAAKQLESAGPSGERLFDYAVFDAMRAGCERVVFVIRDQLWDTFEADVVPQWRARIDVELAVQHLEDAPAEFRQGRVKPWGTAHAVLAGARVCHPDGNVLVVNADDWYGAQAYQAVLHCLEHDAAGNALAGYELGHTLSEHGGVSRAICRVDADSLLTNIEEHTGIVRQGEKIVDDHGEVLPANALASMNLWGFCPEFLASLESAFHAFVHAHGADPKAELRIGEVVNERVAEGEIALRVVPAGERWFGMTFPADLATVKAEVAARVKRGAYPANLFAAS